MKMESHRYFLAIPSWNTTNFMMKTEIKYLGAIQEYWVMGWFISIKIKRDYLIRLEQIQ